ncbi:unnamed protein product [Prorocentrum cordatum]|uniref:Nucleotide-diphospho-sugar transferase domain-containing protein n=1 Tax=Prorocentrum cordatum TaxID=2364126 RepID=A0ABN9STV0_9DINO|nr:unnamed protein product [Polarella glacialis]
MPRGPRSPWRAGTPRAALAAWLAVRRAAAEDGSLHAAAGLENIAAELPPFFDYDCDLVATSRAAATDWNDVYERVASRVADINRPDFGMPEQFRHLVQGPTADQAIRECPLGVLYFTILAFYEDRQLGGDAELLLAMANKVQTFFRVFTVYTVALSRWPVFYALQHFSTHHTLHREHFCEGTDWKLLDWAELRGEANQWVKLTWLTAGSGSTTKDLLDERNAVEMQMSDKFFTMLRSPANHALAQEECEFGFFFLIANQVVAAANRQTHNMPPFHKVMDLVMGNTPFIKVASSGWPIIAVLTMFSDLNKGMWFFGGGDRKYNRGYADWNLRRDELAPLLPSSLGFLSPPWRTAAEGTVATLLALAGTEFAEEVRRRARRREDADGPLRPIVRGLVDAALAIAAAQAPHAQRLAYVVFLYGAKWSRLLPRLSARLRQLGIGHPLLAISIGADAAAACRELSAAGGRAGPSNVVCWVPDTQSQVHRFTAIHALLHLGISEEGHIGAIYMDMDTFLLRDPTPRIMAHAEGLDAVFARHADADCINIGVFFIRSTPKTVWLSQFLAWYHDHPFEIDQRGLHVFLGLPSERMQIAYPPADLVAVRGGVLDDVNEVVIGTVGWYGSHASLLIMHWCQRPIEQKEEEIWAAYDAADAADEHGMALAPALAAASPARSGHGCTIDTVHCAVQSTSWAKVQNLRAILDSYRRTAPPMRSPCW